MALLPVPEAIERILSDVEVTGVETVSLTDAHGRVLAEDLAAKLTQPPFAGSAMDGYAVVGAAVAAGSQLTVLGSAQAGRGFDGAVSQDTCVRIFTGAPMPEGADTVVIQENVTANGDVIVVNEPPVAGANVRLKGIDFVEGDVALKRGRVLDAHALTLAAAMGYGELSVARRPRVAILATGDELVPPGTLPSTDQIISSNPTGLAALVRDAGGDPIDLGIAPDDRDALAEKLRAGLDADVLVTIGGASVGDHDLVGPVLTSLGLELSFWKVAIRPGKPLLFGRLNKTRVMGLPGNPVSALICGRSFLSPLVRALAGAPPSPPLIVPARLIADLSENGPRLHLMRGTLDRDSDGHLTVTPLPSQDSSLLSALADASCLIWREPAAPACQAGSVVTVEPL